MGFIPSKIQVYSFTVPSNPVHFMEWITVLTISLAPLILHIAAGTPHPSILTDKDRGPKWHDLMCLHNPTSILWCYAAIADRRIRAKDWRKPDMAAANAVFWTAKPVKRRTDASAGYTTVGGEDQREEEILLQQARGVEQARQGNGPRGEQGWNGTEDMVIAGAPYCTRLPSHASAEFFSWETLVTIIVTLQGVQTLYNVVGAIHRTIDGNSTGFQDGADKVFTPFALFGLFRLCAAVYLTSTGYAYSAQDDAWTKSAVKMAPEYMRSLGSDMTAMAGTTWASHGNHVYPGMREHHHLQQYNSYGHMNLTAAAPNDAQRTLGMDGGPRYHSTKYLPSVLFRCAYIFLLFLIWILSILRGTPVLADHSGHWTQSVTTVLTGSFYFLFASCTLVLLAIYFRRGSTQSTIIPCIGTVWYKVYTLIVFAWMLAMLIVACCETSMMPCGRYTSSGAANWGAKTDCK